MYAITVGNEVISRRDLSQHELVGYVRKVRGVGGGDDGEWGDRWGFSAQKLGLGGSGDFEEMKGIKGSRCCWRVTYRPH